MAPILSYAELPVDKSHPFRSAWGMHGQFDQLGTLNRLTKDVVIAAGAEIQTGERSTCRHIPRIFFAN